MIDEAYIDFSDKPSFINQIDKLSESDSDADFQQGFRTGSSKNRNGLYKSTAIIQYFNKMKPPYNISTINQKAALNKLEKTEDGQETD